MRPIDGDALKRKEQRLATQAWKMQVKASVETILNQFIDDIDHAPTVDAVPVVHGRWIDIDSEMYTWKIRCNKCGHERSMMSTGQIYPMYCEDCGTRMDGKNDDHEKAD